MSDFNPDAYLQKKGGSSFDPDAYLSKKGAPAKSPLAEAPTQPQSTLSKAGDALASFAHTVKERFPEAAFKRGIGDVNWLDAAKQEITKPIPEGAMIVDNKALDYVAFPQAGAAAAAKGLVAGARGVRAIGRRALEFTKDAIPLAAGAISDEAFKKLTGENSMLGKEIGTGLAIARRVGKAVKK